MTGGEGVMRASHVPDLASSIHLDSISTLSIFEHSKSSKLGAGFEYESAYKGIQTSCRTRFCQAFLIPMFA